MKVRPALGRRSFLAYVTGGALAGTALIGLDGRAIAQPADNDVGKHADSGHGVMGITDMDSGANADPAGHYRPASCSTGITDRDNARTGDPINCGRGRRRAPRPVRRR